MNIIYRQGKMFKINTEALPESSRTSDVINALYYNIYVEFVGASTNKKYKHLTNYQKMQEINLFAENWLKARKLL